MVFHVSICGGGIGGLTLALVLAKYSVLPVEIFEAGPTITTFGAGITFFGRAMGIMKDLGLYNELVKMAIRPPEENAGPYLRKSDQPNGYGWFYKTLDRGTFSVHRKDLINLLLRHVPASCKIHTSKKLAFYEVDSHNEIIVLHFSDGSRTVTDVLVGADGIHSATRKTMYRNFASSSRDASFRKRLLSCIDPVWTGILVYRNMIPIAKILKEHPTVEPPTRLTIYTGKNKHMVAFPISEGRLITAVIFIHNCAPFGTPFEGRWVMDVSEKEVVDRFEDWEPEAQALLKCIEKPSRWALHSVRSLPYYVDGKIALLGDAAHAMEPHFGAGAGQAMEDADVLGRLLVHELTHAGNVHKALKVYEEIRLPFANHIVQRTRDVGRRYGLSLSAEGSVSADLRPEELDRVRKSIEDLWGWQDESGSMWVDAEKRWRRKYGSRTKL